MVLQMVKGLGRIQRTNFLKTGDVWVAVFKQGKQLGELLSETATIDAHNAKRFPGIGGAV